MILWTARSGGNGSSANLITAPDWEFWSPFGIGINDEAICIQFTKHNLAGRTSILVHVTQRSGYEVNRDGNVKPGNVGDESKPTMSLRTGNISSILLVLFGEGVESTLSIGDSEVCLTSGWTVQPAPQCSASLGIESFTILSFNQFPISGLVMF